MDAEQLRFKKLIGDFEGKHILIIGDVMLDRYITGTADRISPEAPVLIMLNKFEYCALGGAGNVALNVKNLGAKASLIGGIGEDNESGIMIEIANHAGINYSFVTDENRPTTLKTRVIVGGQHLLRIDKEQTHEWNIPAHDIPSHINELEHQSGEFDAIIISDYQKGFVTQDVINYALQYKIPIVVDPKTKYWERFKGATVLTPNQKELSSYLGNKSHSRIDDMIRFLGFDGILETCGEDGVTIWKSKPTNGSHEKSKETIAGYAVPALDITGAGDTFTAAVALSLASGASLNEAAEIANMAGAISVQCPGCYCVKNTELQEFNSNREKFDRSSNTKTANNDMEM